MRILLDENIPVQLKNHLPGHEVASVNDSAIGWKNIANGKLLSQMEGRFDLLITADKNIYAQQNLAGRTVSILVLPTNRRKDVVTLSTRIVAAVSSMSAGEYLILEPSAAMHRLST